VFELLEASPNKIIVQPMKCSMQLYNTKKIMSMTKLVVILFFHVVRSKSNVPTNNVDFYFTKNHKHSVVIPLFNLSYIQLNSLE
jgi:malate/lactate dehydrogenase